MKNDKNTTENSRADEVSDTAICSPLELAVKLVNLGDFRDNNNYSEWSLIASEMCQYCEGSENVKDASARIILEEMKKGICDAWMIFDTIEDDRADEWQNNWVGIVF
jgi:hypothetical protein